MSYVTELEKRCEELQEQLMEAASLRSMFSAVITKSGKVYRCELTMSLFESHIEPLFTIIDTTLDEKPVWVWTMTSKKDKYYDRRLTIQDVVEKILESYNLRGIKVRYSFKA
jgi:hypothetical protein